MTRFLGWKRSRRALLPLAALAVVAALGLTLLAPAPAADHRDGPIFANTAASGPGDINDIYVFKSPQTATNTVLAMTAQPFTGSVTPTTFAFDQYFDMQVDNTGDAVADLTFRITFGAPDVNGVQDVTLRGLPAAKFPPTGILAQGKTGTNIPITGGGITGGMFRAANHDDPFVFDAVGFNRLLNHATAAAALPANDTNPLTHYPRDKGGPSPARNFFGPNVNTLAIIVEIPTSKLLRAGNPQIAIWGRIEKGGVQIDRMGRPAINTALVPPIPRGPNFPIAPGTDLRNAFNAALPSNDRRDFRTPIRNTMVNFYPLTGAQADALLDNALGATVLGPATGLLPDVLTYDTSKPFVVNVAGDDSKSAFPNGRQLRDPVIHIELSLLTGGVVKTDNVDDDNGTLITDGTNGTAAAFPYFGPPSNPPGGIITMP